MKTVRKNSKQFAAAKANAKDIKCYSLSNCFTGKEVNNAKLIEADFDFYAAKLSLNNNGLYTLAIHGNLWYTFTL